VLLYALYQLPNSLGLVASGLILGG